jgi:protoporphyrinogen oxidase
VSETQRKVVIIGGGPAGLTAAFQLTKARVPSIVLEKDSVLGGISRTAEYKGFLFDIGGHRFFTKVQVVEDMWQEVMGGDFLRRPRLSRIYYNKKFFYYPLRLTNALFGLGIWNSFLVGLSYLKAQLTRGGPEDTFDQWVTNRFGKRLFNIFFKTYTEKVWGIPCSEITAEWAAQRIKNLSLVTALRNALVPSQSKDKSKVVTTLIDAFDYPKRGPGMMWERVGEIVDENGGHVRRDADVVKVSWDGTAVESIEISSNGNRETVAGTHFISSMPVRELVQKLSPPAPDEVLRAAESLNYRDFLTVAIVVNQPELFKDNWIYIHDSEVKVGRIQNFKNWSPYMVPDPEKTCLGLEYFCFEGDGLWTMPDADLVELGTRELDQLGLVDPADVEDGDVVRMPKAYPVYDSEYRDALGTVRAFLQKLGNLQLVGRNGMHRYNNQDHAMLTAMLAVENILGADYDLWEVNVDEEYHEEASGEEQSRLGEYRLLASTQPRVPERAQKVDPAG